MDKKKEKCLECGRKFSNLTHLRVHIRKSHPNKLDELAPLRYRNPTYYAFSCDVCKRNYNRKAHLRFHMKTHPELKHDDDDRPARKPKKCALCDSYQSFLSEEMLEHYQNVHEIPIQIKKLVFSSADEFSAWKLRLEDDTNSRFVKNYTNTRKTHVSTLYLCHRSGNYVSVGKGLRHLKTQGSNKINGYCPASITLKKTADEWIVSFVETHVGHETDIGHLTLTNSERESLAAKIASEVPFSEILNEIRNSVTNSSLKRIHLLTRRDLDNIRRCNNLSSAAMRHPNDAVSVESLINEMRNGGQSAVLFYKPEGTIMEDKPELKSDDFVLLIMTPAQCEVLNKYGRDCVCLDRTHGLNSDQIELNTLLVIDDTSEGFPCAFFFSNRSDAEVFKLFFSEIKSVMGTITSRVFMSDLTDSFFNAWTDVMGPPQKRLYCTWQVDLVWRENLSKIKGNEKQAQVYKTLRTILEETDQTAFEKMLRNFCNSTDDDTFLFKIYFIENYFNNGQRWAYCFRSPLELNANVNLERIHWALEYIYLKDKKAEKLDKALVALMRFVRDKSFDRLIVVRKGKITSMLKILRERHKSSENLDATCIRLVEGGWQVPSISRNEIYFIEEKTTTCTCRLVCPQCRVCIHRYVCSCLDSSIKFNMCKHIHLLAVFRINETDKAQLDSDGENVADGSLHGDVKEECDIEETTVVLSQANEESAPESLDLKKEEVMQEF